MPLSLIPAASSGSGICSGIVIFLSGGAGGEKPLVDRVGPVVGDGLHAITILDCSDDPILHAYYIVVLNGCSFRYLQVPVFVDDVGHLVGFLSSQCIDDFKSDDLISVFKFCGSVKTPSSIFISNDPQRHAIQAAVPIVGIPDLFHHGLPVGRGDYGGGLRWR